MDYSQDIEMRLSQLVNRRVPLDFYDYNNSKDASKYYKSVFPIGFGKVTDAGDSTLTIKYVVDDRSVYPKYTRLEEMCSALDLSLQFAPSVERMQPSFTITCPDTLDTVQKISAMLRTDVIDEEKTKVHGALAEAKKALEKVMTPQLAQEAVSDIVGEFNKGVKANGRV